MKDLHCFFRKIRLKKLFFNRENINLEENKSGLKPPSNFSPPSESIGMEVEMFERSVLQKIQKVVKFVPRPTYNITRDENVALKQLKENDNITIKPCDKGGGIVILDAASYRDKMHDMLNSPRHYKKILLNPEPKLKLRILKMVESAVIDGHICQKEAEFLPPTYTRLPIIYGLAKTHKNECNPPLRPIVSTIGSALEPLSKYVDHFLQPLVAKLQSYIKDTGHLISKIEGLPFNEKEEILVTLDLEALYTNIPQKEALNAISDILMLESDLTNSPFIIQCLKLVLENNFFEFEGQLFHQIQGVSMGAACAPSVACLYMGLFESQHIYNDLAPFQENVYVWSRFIDDIFFIWKGEDDLLQEFTAWLNAANNNLRFSANHSKIKVEFLDVWIGHSDSKLTVSLYTKPTSRNTLLHYNSYHPRSQKESIPFSQFLRLRRNCTTVSDYLVHAEALKEKLLNRRYPSRVIRNALKRARFFNRESMFSERSNTPTEKLVCVMKHSQLNNKIHQVINSQWHLLNCNQTEQYLLKPVFAFRRNKNLRNYLVRAKNVSKDSFIQKSITGEHPIKGHHKCGNCHACSQAITGESIKINDKMVYLQEMTNCRTSNLIYAILCPCNLPYVGETSRECRIRIGEHKSNIRLGKTSAPLVNHWINAQHHEADLHWIILEKIRPVKGIDMSRIRKKRETFWIFSLDAVSRGLNEIIPWENAIV